MMTREGSTKIVNSMNPGAGGFVLGRDHIRNIVKMHYFFTKPSSLLPGIDQTNQICNNDDQGRVNQNCKFHDPPGQGFLCYGMII